MSRTQADGATRSLRLLVAATAVVATLACSDSSGPLNVENPANANVASLEFRPPNLSVGEGRTQQLTAIARAADGTPIPSAVISWQSTDPRVVAVDAKGTVEGLGRGTAAVTAQAGAAKAEASVRVRAPLSSIGVAVPTGRVNVGERVKLDVTLVTTDGDTVSSSEVAILWSTSDDSVLEVDDDGTVTGKGRGVGRVKAESEGKKGSRSVRVSSDEEEGEPQVTVDPAHSVMYAVEDTLQLTAELSDSTGNTVDDASFTWQSLDTKVASVTSAGKVISRGVGTVLIAVSAQGAADTAVVEVEQVVASLEISPETASIDIGQAVQFSAAATDSNGVSISSPELSWSSSDPAIATVTQDGLATGENAGEAAIRVAADGTGVSATASLTVSGSSDPPPPPPPGIIPAFPGAEGWGATALEGCRDLPLVVHQVTNTNDSGTGSLRDIIENRVRPDRFDVVIFTTGGLIQLQSLIREHRRDCLYIAGQTAPGGGISLVGDVIEFRRSDDLVVRHLRHRGQTKTTFRSRGGHRIIYDHITASWGGADQSGGAYILHLLGDCSLATPYPLDGATLQNSLIYEPDKQHPTVLGLTGGPKVDPCSWRTSAHKNVIMGPGSRAPKCSALEVSVTNNVFYNWTSRGTATNQTAECDFIANYHKPGPAATTSYGHMPFVVGDGCGGSGEGDCWYSVYVAENRNHKNDYGASAGNPWEGGSREVACRRLDNDPDPWCPENGAVVPELARRYSPLPAATIPVNKQSISDAVVDGILDRAGHSRRLACDGSWVPIRDDTDQQRIDWFYSGGGPTSTVDVSTIQVPVPASGTPCADSDGDGLPDEYEERYSGSPTGLQVDRVTDSGYLVIELYMAGLAPDWRP